MIHPAEFGDAIIWKDGFVHDDLVRQALASLLSEAYLLEHSAALELTQRGDRHLYGEVAMAKHGARVYRLGAKLLVKQTVLRGTSPEYAIDEDRERHVSDDDDFAIAAAIRDAVNGRL
jgi:hypothetical protein